MVGIPREISIPSNRQRLLTIMREVDFPGGKEDHHWMAHRLETFACKLNEGSPSDFLEDLLLSGLLMERGFDVSASSQLHGRCFPDRWLRAVPALLRHGCPESSWRLIETGVLRFDGEGSGHCHQWCIEGRHLKPYLLAWHELGKCLIFQNLARGLLPLIQDASGQAEITLTGADRHTGRHWLRELKSALRALGSEPASHQLRIG